MPSKVRLKAATLWKSDRCPKLFRRNSAHGANYVECTLKTYDTKLKMSIAKISLWKSYCNIRGSTAQLLQYSKISTKQYPSPIFFCDSPLLHLYLSGLQKVIQDNHALVLYQLCRNQLIIPDLPSILCPISIITKSLDITYNHNSCMIRETILSDKRNRQL